jgi:hypothetical protein
MADVRYQAFVSSTYTDLREERQAAISALLQLDAMPAGMELFPAADDEAWTLIQRVIDESDYYLLIVGGRYGSVTNAGVSFTEKEYDYAVSQAEPVIAFLHGSPEDISVGKRDIDPSLRAKLEKFTEKVKQAKHVKTWMSAEDLAGKIALSFSSFVRSYPAIGWVRADSRDSPETLKALAEARAKITELAERIISELAGPPPGSIGLADGEDPLEVSFTASAIIENLDKSVSSTAPKQTYPVTTKISWNTVFAFIGPSIINES